MLSISSSNLLKRIRYATFKAMLGQEIGWFDKPEHGVGQLSTKIEIEADMCQKTTAVTLSDLILNSSKFGFSLLVAFYYNWSITSIVSIYIIFTVLSSMAEKMIIEKFIGREMSLAQEAGQVIKIVLIKLDINISIKLYIMIAEGFNFNNIYIMIDNHSSD